MAYIRKQLAKTPRVRVKKVESKSVSRTTSKKAHELETEQTEKEELAAAAGGGYITRLEFNNAVCSIVSAVNEVAAELHDYKHRSLWERIRDVLTHRLW